MDNKPQIKLERNKLNDFSQLSLTIFSSDEIQIEN